MKKPLTAVLATLILASAGGIGAYLYSERYWPFSTGTQAIAFGQTTFGMSEKEVQRTASGQNYTSKLDAFFAKLDEWIESKKGDPPSGLDQDLYKEISYCPSVNIPGYKFLPREYLDNKDFKKITYRLALFERPAYIFYSFFNDQLYRVDIEIFDNKKNASLGSQEVFRSLSSSISETHPPIELPIPENDGNGIVEDSYSGQNELNRILIYRAVQKDHSGQSELNRILLYRAVQEDHRCILMKNYWRPFYEKVEKTINQMQSLPFDASRRL